MRWPVALVFGPRLRVFGPNTSRPRTNTSLLVKGARGLGGMTPVWHAGSPGSTPGGSTRSVCVRWSRVAEFDQLSGRLVFVPRPAAIECKPITYGREPDTAWPGRFAKAIAPLMGREGSNPSPSALLWW